MQTKKKSFQIYFDSIPMLMLLSDEQLGIMMKELLHYAAVVAEEPETMMENICEELPEKMSDEAKMAFCFTAASVYRDTRKWWQTTNARLRREEKKREAGAGEPYSLSSLGEISYPRRF